MMNDVFKVIIDGVLMDFFTEFSWSYEWIVDAYRNQNDFAVISNPTQKRKLTLKTGRLNQTQFQRLFRVIGKTDIRHTVQLYDDFAGQMKQYSMYNSDVQGSKKSVGGQVMYLDVSFSLIEM